MRESILRQGDKSLVPQEEKGIWALEVEIGVWGSQEGGRDNVYFSTFLSLSHTKLFFFFFSLSLELMITQQTTQFKLCTRDYITTMYPV